jgi:peptide/nickel transport system permease protein
MIAIGFLLFFTFVAIFRNFLVPFNPNDQNIPNANAAASLHHLLGTDHLGRDILSRLIVGAGVSLRISLQVVLSALAIALPIGLIAGYFGGAIDNLLMRVADAGLSFPALILALAIAGILGPGLGNAALAISIVLIPGFMRLVRGSALAVAQETYVDASRSIGTPTRRILFRRILPNIRSPILVAASLSFGGAILAEAGLSFLNLSVQPPNASWGNMLRNAYDNSLYTHPWQLVIPGVAIATTVLAYNTLGDGIRDAFGTGSWSPARHGKGRWWWLQRRRRTRRGITEVIRATVPAASPATGAPPLLEVAGLTVEFTMQDGPVRVVDDVSFVVRGREILGLVGESGSGKTVTSLSIMRLLASPPGTIVGGAAYFCGRDLLSLTFEEMRRVRGAEISMVFQDPMTSLNPAFTIGDQLVEAMRLHQDFDRRTARLHARELLGLVEIPAADQRLREYPHQLSGGMRQRVMLAIALACRPKLLIADEPTTALDVTIQAQILDLLRMLQHELDLSVIFVTHNLGVVADLCDRVAVMYAGQLVEQAKVHELFVRPQHPYTEGLLRAMPQCAASRAPLYVIPGQVPHARAYPTGCRFHPRCSYATDVCCGEPVALLATSNVKRTAMADERAARCRRCDELVLRGAE